MSSDDAVDASKYPLLAKAMWYFWTPTSPYDLPEYDPTGTAPLIPTAGAIPDPQKPFVDIYFNARLPQYDEPNWWTTPVEEQFCTCCAFFQTWQLLGSYTEGATSMSVITGISYEAPGLDNFDAFEIQILRDGSEVARFEDMKVDAAQPNPAEQFVMAGHVRQMPTWIRVDRNQALAVRVMIKGIYPYPNGSDVQYTGNVCVYLHGYRTAIFDDRDGAPRPNQAGALSQVELNMESPLDVDGLDAKRLRETMDRYLRFMLNPNPPGLGS